MATLIVRKNPKSLWRMAANATDLADYNGINDTEFDLVDVSDADFQSLRTNQKKYDADTGSVVDLAEGETGDQLSETNLKTYLSEVTDKLKLFIDNNVGDQFATQCQNYKTVLEGVDTSSLSYPLNWEKHCLDNGIIFLHPLQIG
jgi:hypothetical protein